MRLIHIAIVAFLGFQSLAEAAPSHRLSAEQSAEVVQKNRLAAGEWLIQDLLRHDRSGPRTLTVLDEPKRLPWAEYGEAGYLIFSDEGPWKSDEAKLKMAENLPQDMTLVVFTGVSDLKYQTELFQKYAKRINPERLKVIYLSQGSDGFWARDAVPVPAWTLTPDGSQNFSVVDAEYYHGFKNDREVSEYFNAKLVDMTNFQNEGGNFLANEDGNCIVVNNERVAEIPDGVYKTKYGCQKMLRLPFIKGIGHVDESVKFIDKKTLITDDPTYKKLLLDEGYTVVDMPRPQKKYETYVNSLIVNGTAYVPVFNESKDQEAIQVYESFGLKVVPLDSIQLSNKGMGSIHCITMVYPKVEFNNFLEAITAGDF